MMPRMTYILAQNFISYFYIVIWIFIKIFVTASSKMFLFVMIYFFLVQCIYTPDVGKKMGFFFSWFSFYHLLQISIGPSWTRRVDLLPYKMIYTMLGCKKKVLIINKNFLPMFWNCMLFVISTRNFSITIRSLCKNCKVGHFPVLYALPLCHTIFILHIICIFTLSNEHLRFIA